MLWFSLLGLAKGRLKNGFQTALNYSGSNVWIDLPTNKRQNPCRYGHRANLLVSLRER